jgi:hypothetical protein
VWWLGGIYSPTHQNGRWGGCLSMGAPDSPVRHRNRTVRCASHVTQPLGFNRWSSDNWDHRTVRWCTGVSLFTVRCAFWRCSDSACAVHTLFTFADDRWRSSRCSAWHTGQSGATSNSPVNYSGNPKLSSSELISLVHRTLSGGALDSPVRQTRAAFGWFCSFLFEP